MVWFCKCIKLNRILFYTQTKFLYTHVRYISIHISSAYNSCDTNACSIHNYVHIHMYTHTGTYREIHWIFPYTNNGGRCSRLVSLFQFNFHFGSIQLSILYHPMISFDIYLNHIVSFHKCTMVNFRFAIFFFFAFFLHESNTYVSIYYILCHRVARYFVFLFFFFFD